MKQSTSLFLATAALAGWSGLAAATTPAGACNHNNCLRAVIAKAFTTRSGVEDCGSFMRVTVTPPTTTITATVTPTTTLDESTVTVTVEAGPLVTPVRRGERVQEEAVEARDEPARDPAITAGGTTFPVYASACTSFAKYSSACSCVGVSQETITVDAPSTTVTVTAEAETVTPAAATATVTNIVRNGGFETGNWGPWVPTYAQRRRVYGSVKRNVGKDSQYGAFCSDMVNNDLWEFYQDIRGVPGTTYKCSYDWKFLRRYETVYTDDVTYVPYIHGYINNRYLTEDVPTYAQAGKWQTTEFTFVSQGVDRWWFDCASPQPPRARDGGGPQELTIDNMVCIAQE